MVLDGNRFRVVSYEISHEKIKKPYTFVVLSDLHNKVYGKNHEKLIRAIEKEQPAGVLIAGDLLTAKPGYPLHLALDLLEQLAPKYPIYYGMGNHEARLFLYPEVYGTMGADYEEKLKGLGISLLRNESRSLGEDLVITGLDMKREYYKRFKKTTMTTEYLKKTLGEKNKDKFQILLAHHPDYFQEYSSWGADLVLSGHVHGGMVRLPFLGGVISPALRLFPKYDGGSFEEKESRMILSRGLGMHTIPVRLFNPGELVVLKLSPT
ncbi:MAG: metallophosphoesterase [Lachnospiraceae bacterium]|nr:metallophosphoesterase [Lachnospiraceae bacterium]